MTSVTFARATKSLEFTIVNEGDQIAQLPANPVEIANDINRAFGVAGQPGQRVLDPGESTTLTISFNPPVSGEFTAIARVNALPQARALSLALAGVGVGSPIVPFIDGSPIDPVQGYTFPELQVGEKITKTVSLFHNGDASATPATIDSVPAVRVSSLMTAQLNNSSRC